jgi:DNA invertase Pin-like site-specific DNA recombinase
VGGREGESFVSPTLQRERMEAWCTSQGHDLISIAEDLDVSGASTNRDQLEALVKEVEQGRLDGLVVATLDRFGRSLPYAIALIDRINRAGGQFISVADGFDTRTPYGELALNVMLSVAQFEVQRIRGQWRAVVERNIAAGRHPGATPPFGYSRGPDRRLVPNHLAPVVQQIFARAASGASMSEIARDLAQRGIDSGSAGQRMTRSLVRHVLRNRAYLGEARSGMLVNPEAHQPLIDDDLWRRADSTFRGRPAARRERQPALLAGLVRCQACRYVMAPSIRNGKRRYRCLGVTLGRTCPAPAFLLEDQLLPLLESALFERLDEIVAQPIGNTAEAEELGARRERAHRQLLDYRDDAELPDVIGYSAWKDGLRVKQEALDTAEAELAKYEQSRPTGLPDVATLRAAWPEMEPRIRRQVFAALFDAIVIRKHPSRSERLPIADRVRLMTRGGLVGYEIPRSGRIAARQLDPFPWPSNPHSPWITLG